MEATKRKTSSQELAKGRRSSWDQHLLRLQQWLTDHDADLLASW